MSHDPTISDALTRRENETDTDRQAATGKVACYLTVGIAIEYEQGQDRAEVVDEVLRDLAARHGKGNVDQLSVEDDWWSSSFAEARVNNTKPQEGD